MDPVQLNVRRVMWWVFLGCCALVIGLSAAGEAQAQTVPPYTCASVDGPCTRQEAYDQCMAHAAYNSAVTGRAANCDSVAVPQRSYTCRRENSSGGWMTCSPNYIFRWKSEACPAGSVWDEGTKTCTTECLAGEWPDPTNPGQCLSPDKCMARNTDPGIMLAGPRPSLTLGRCAGGCWFAMDSSDPGFSKSVNVPTSGGPSTVFRGVMEYTGGSCAAGEPDVGEDQPKEQPKNECSDDGSFCRKPNGQECYQSTFQGNPVGKMICWDTGETGDKTDGPVLQKRQPGEPTPPPSVDLPNGDTANKDGPSTVTTTTVNNNGGNSVTITTTTTNYNTVTGANAGDKNQGESSDGNNPDGDEDSETETGAPSYDCSSPPTCSSTDTIGCAMLRQTWSNHCKWGKTFEGEDPTDLSGVPAIEGDDSWFQDGEDPGDAFGALPSGGWAARGSCPIEFSFTLKGTTHTLDSEQLCTLLDALAALVLLAASIAAMTILGSGYK